MLCVDVEFIGVYDLDEAISYFLLKGFLGEGFYAEFLCFGGGKDSILAIDVFLFFVGFTGGGKNAVFVGFGGGEDLEA